MFDLYFLGSDHHADVGEKNVVLLDLQAIVTMEFPMLVDFELALTNFNEGFSIIDAFMKLSTSEFL